MVYIIIGIYLVFLPWFDVDDMTAILPRKIQILIFDTQRYIMHKMPKINRHTRHALSPKDHSDGEELCTIILLILLYDIIRD